MEQMYEIVAENKYDAQKYATMEVAAKLERYFEEIRFKQPLSIEVLRDRNSYIILIGFLSLLKQRKRQYRNKKPLASAMAVKIMVENTSETNYRISQIDYLDIPREIKSRAIRKRVQNVPCYLVYAKDPMALEDHIYAFGRYDALLLSVK